MKKFVVMLIPLSLFFTACEDKTENVTDVAAIEDELLQILNSDETLAFEGLDDGGAVEAEYEDSLEINEGMAKTLVDTLWPDNGEYRIRFGRRITDVETTVTFDVDEEAGTALADISRLVTGQFIVVALDSNHAVVDSFIKDFESTFNRKVSFIERDTEDSTGHRWRINAFTIGVGSAGDKVSITQIQIFAGDNTNPLYSYSANEVGDLFISRDSIPTFAAWQPVRVEVTVENAGPEFPYHSGEGVMFHFGRHRHHKARRLMNDSGIGADATANDNVFTKMWLVHGPGWNHHMNRPFRQRVFRSFFDLIDFGTLYAEQEGVHTNVWALPYQTVRP